MFGNKNKMKPEEIQNMKESLEKKEQFYQKVASIRGMCEASISEMNTSRIQTKENLDQINNNIDKVILQAKDSIESQATLAGEIRQVSENLARTDDDYAQFVEKLKEQASTVIGIVDANKHYTSPSKALKEFPEKLDSKLAKCTEEVEQLAEFRKQMGVLALNSAIEAGRMGDAGKNFIDAAEEIRAYTSRFAGTLGSLEHELASAKKENAILKEQVDKLVSLLKDNNVATANLMKKTNENLQIAGGINISGMVFEVAGLKEKIVDIKNNQEEILKEEERNKIQIEDIYGELELQQKNATELYNGLNPILQETK